MSEINVRTGLGAPTLLSADELAGQLKMSPRSVWRLESAGKIPRPIRLGRLVRWSQEEITRWITAGAPSRHEWEAGKQSLN